MSTSGVALTIWSKLCLRHIVLNYQGEVLQGVDLSVQTGKTFVPAKPWNPGTESRWETELASLSKEVQGLVKNMLVGEDNAREDNV